MLLPRLNMQPCFYRLCGWGLIGLIGLSCSPESADGAVPIPWQVTLTDSQGKSARVGSISDRKLQVFCFLGSECPLAKLYGPRLNALAATYASKNVVFFGINSNLQDSLADVDAYVRAASLNFPVYKDFDQVALKYLRAKRTPEVIVVDSQGMEVYRGRIDDQYQPGLVRNQPTRHDLQQAIEEYLSEQAVSVSQTDAVGCVIAVKRVADLDASVTFCDQVIRVLHRHCIECHRPGEIGPFSLLDYHEVVGWADMMLETIEQHRMPPWHANPQHGDFVNARHMPESDIDVLRKWLAAGTPYGNAEELPDLEIGVEQRLAKADDVIPMQEKPFTIPAEGKVEYQYFVVDPNFTEDRWINAARLVPSNRAVVHHGIVFVRPPDGVEMNGIGWLTAYVPGQVHYPSPPHRARRVPAGSKLVFQMHYTPTGKTEEDCSVLHLTYAKPDEVTEEHVTLATLNQELEIPAGASHVEIEAQSEGFPANGKLLAISPHMHLRGKSIRVESQAKDCSEILLDVPHYDFNWQHTYIPRTPLPLNAIDQLRFVATFDNSKENPFNPDPSAFVTWGEQTWEEMAIVFFEVAVPRDRGKRKATESQPDQPHKAVAGPLESIDEATEHHRKLARQLMDDLDANGDGKVYYEECDEVVQFRSFRGYDLNRDRVIDFEEAVAAIKKQNR